jgi:hypothetical protein
MNLADVRVNHIEFSLHSISQLGVFPIRVRGAIKDNKLEIKISQYSPIMKKNRPIEVYRDVI